MITLIHGDDSALSRNYYFELKSKSKDGIVLEGAKITFTDLTQALEGQDLFGNTKEIFIEELLSKRKNSKEVDALISLLTQTPQTVFLWESKELTAKQLSLFKGAAIKLFKIPATIFAFLDAFRPHNAKQLIELFHKTLEDKDPEFVFFMLQRQVRILLTLNKKDPSVIASKAKQSSSEIATSQTPRNDGKTVISEVARLAPWQKGKLEKQAGMFAEEKLKDIHSQIFDIELDLKTGNLTLPLQQTLDLLLLKI